MSDTDPTAAQSVANELIIAINKCSEVPGLNWDGGSPQRSIVEGIAIVIQERDATIAALRGQVEAAQALSEAKIISLQCQVDALNSMVAHAQSIANQALYSAR